MLVGLKYELVYLKLVSLQGEFSRNASKNGRITPVQLINILKITLYARHQRMYNSQWPLIWGKQSTYAKFENTRLKIVVVLVKFKKLL